MKQIIQISFGKWDSDFKLTYKNRPTSIELMAKKFNNFTLAEKVNTALTLFRMGLFRAAHVWRGWGKGKKPPLLKICYTYPTMMKPDTVISYLKKIQKIYKWRSTPLDFCWNQHFSPKMSNFCCIKKYFYF